MSSYIIDCDPGHDDAVALLFAAKSLSLHGITTVFGNSNVTNTTRNALALLNTAGLKIPVARGARQPLKGSIRSAEHIHGKSGLDGADLKDGKIKPEKKEAHDFLIEAADDVQDLVIIAIGPLTNVAMAIEKEPKIMSYIKEISIMGGSTSFGNVSATAEFNIFADPEAAQIVFSSGIPLRMAGLNVTSTFGISAQQVATLSKSSGFLPRQIGLALNYYLTQQSKIYNRSYAPLHDICAVIPYTHKELIQYQFMHVDVECEGQLTRGQTVCDQRNLFKQVSSKSQQKPNCDVAIASKGEAIIDLVLQSLLDFH
ncbi:MAG: pyrimidine-specific ribonucleoside hydrolase RihA [Gammaproteobacteria bacterium TMED1]|nr:MAG: pyrimidine-specific ribonucleoside hydrolase RihA [Gammaproteobacteria bacterium TMED1]|tara:strand:- start:2900 stop:3838 length:939 start_codon:yes stop_codon:yes gene_type:complete